MIAGISLLLEPSSPYASDMWDIVTHFVEHHPYNPKSDDFTRREAAIVSTASGKMAHPQIHTLHKRAVALRGSQTEEGASESPVHPLQDNTSFERGAARRGSRATGDSSRPCSSHGSQVASMVSAQDTPVAASQGLETPRSDNEEEDSDHVQNLFNNFLTANSEIGLGGGGKQPPSELPAQSLLGVFGITTPVVGVIAAAAGKSAVSDTPSDAELLEQQFASDSSLAFGAVPSSLYSLPALVADSKDVNTPQYWDTFADGESIFLCMRRGADPLPQSWSSKLVLPSYNLPFGRRCGRRGCL